MGIKSSGRMGGRWGRRIALSLTTILASGFALPAMAQSPHPNLDANGVDLTTGVFIPRIPIASLGSGQSRLPLIAYDGQHDNWSDIYLTKTTSGGSTFYAVTMGETNWDNFTSVGSASTRGTGATLSYSGDDLIYRTLDGVEIVFSKPVYTTGGASNLCDAYNTTNCTLLGVSIVRDNGMEVDLGWDIFSNCTDVLIDPDSPPPDCTYSWRLASVSNAAGYEVDWAFSTGGTSGSSNPGPSWFLRTGATLKNGSTTVGTVSYGNPSSGVYTITTPGGNTWRFNGALGVVTAIRRPSASSDTTTISSSGGVMTFTRDGIATSYSRSVSGSTATMVVTDALSHTATVVSDMTKYRVTSVTDGLSKTTSYAYDSVGRPTEITYPEGDKTQFAYDSRGNPTTTTRKAKSGSGLSDIVTTASYDSSCSNVVTCNQPNYIQDALGNQTDFTYDSSTGNLVTVTAPAATTGAKRPQTRYSYTTNGAGISLLTGISRCQTGATTDTPSCVGTSDEVKTTIGYDSNLNVTSITNADGATSPTVSATTAATYSAAGDLLTVDGPLTGTADTTTFRYDADRNRVGIISADPDGGGSLKRRALKTTYNADGQPTVVELGTVTGTDDTAWAGFSSAQQLTSSYDTNAFRTKDVLTASSTTYQVTQYSYDAVGRLECTAGRMNSSAWGSLPSDACTLQTTGSYGDDHIAKST